MADDDQYALCWNNFNKNLTAGFYSLYARGNLTDVTLAAEGQTLRAHRMVLSVCSPYFQTMFASAPAQQHPILFLKDISFKNLSDLVTFMYCGEVHVKQEELASFISIAESLKIKGLTESTADNHSPSAATKTEIVSTRGTRAAKRSLKRHDPEEIISDIEPGQKVVRRQSTSRILTKKQAQLVQQREDPLQQDTVPSTSTSAFMDTGPGIGVAKAEPAYDEHELDAQYMQQTSEGAFNPSDLVEKDDNYDTTGYDLDDTQEQEPDDMGGPEPEAGSQENAAEQAHSPSTLTFIKTPWSTPCLILGDFMYNCHSLRKNKGYWRCHNYSRKVPVERCRARCVIRDGRIKALTGGPHNHPPHTEKIEKIVRRNSMVEVVPKEEAMSPSADADPDQIMVEEVLEEEVDIEC